MKKIKQGTGLMEQLTHSNHLASSITEKDIEKMINALYNRTMVQPKDPITGKFIKGPKINKYFSKFTILCGDAFMNKFDEAMKEESNKFEWKIMNEDNNSI